MNNDRMKVIIALLIFILILTIPFFFNLGVKKVEHEPILSPEAKLAKECVLSKEYMTKEHMQLLDVWRDEVVRNGNRTFINDKGKSFNMSLSKTCLACHTNKKEFCDRCHNYASVRPYCWDCHIDPKENSNNEE